MTDIVEVSSPRAGPTAAPPVLRVDRLSKSFVGQVALRGVDLEIGARQVHALIGHNGSGKSTLIKVLAGLHRPDPGSGHLVIDGERLREGDPEASRRAGLRFIHQELGLIDKLSVTENLYLGSSYQTGLAWHVRRPQERAEVDRLLTTYGLDIRPETILEDLSAVQRTGVAVARALRPLGARLVVFDEPTATLPEREVARLFELIRGTVEQGASILYVSHRLEELDQIADYVTVLRDGAVVGNGPISEFSRTRLVDLIVGGVGVSRQSAPGDRTTRRHEGGPVALTFEAVRAGVLEDVSFGVSRGEVVGLAGLAGSGVHTIPQLLLGETRLEAGTLRIKGDVMTRTSAGELFRRNVAVLPSAQIQKCIPSISVRENLTLPSPGRFYRGGFYRTSLERRRARVLVDRFKILPADTERPLNTLSGGNRQKVCVAKWLDQETHVLVLDEPTAGIDVGGRADILRLMEDAVTNGLGILVCSSDLEDLADLCSRVLVIRDGRIATELRGSAVTRERITEECYRSTDEG